MEQKFNISLIYQFSDSPIAESLKEEFTKHSIILINGDASMLDLIKDNTIYEFMNSDILIVMTFKEPETFSARIVPIAGKVSLCDRSKTLSDFKFEELDVSNVPVMVDTILTKINKELEK